MYEHRQIGWILIIIFAGFVAGITIFAHDLWNTKSGFGGMMLFIVVSFLFSSLNVQELSDRVKISFGPGLIRKSFLFADIESSSIVDRQWIHGWGIRKIRRGWLFNVSGSLAVELKMNNDKIYRIGTDDPENLLAMIQRRISVSPSADTPS